MTEQERMSRPLAVVDPAIHEAIRRETQRQQSQIELIASENFTSEAILEAAGIDVFAPAKKRAKQFYLGSGRRMVCDCDRRTSNRLVSLVRDSQRG